VSAKVEPVSAKADPVSAGTAEAAASRRPGRPRSERADQAIIEAALSLFAE